MQEGQKLIRFLITYNSFQKMWSTVSIDTYVSCTFLKWVLKMFCFCENIFFKQDVTIGSKTNIMPRIVNHKIYQVSTILTLYVLGVIAVVLL